MNLKYVLIILSGGIIDQVTFSDEAHTSMISRIVGICKFLIWNMMSCYFFTDLCPGKS